MTRSEDRRRAVQGAPERRLIISGTREALSAEDRDAVLDVLSGYVAYGWEIGVGDCPHGVDRVVRDALPSAVRFVADWDRLGKRAGPERNRCMVDWAREAGTCALAAFPGPRSRGTWSAVRIAREAGLALVIKRVSR